MYTYVTLSQMFLHSQVVNGHPSESVLNPNGQLLSHLVVHLRGAGMFSYIHLLKKDKSKYIQPRVKSYLHKAARFRQLIDRLATVPACVVYRKKSSYFYPPSQ